MEFPLKILHIIDGLSPGGKERQLIEILKNVDNSKIEFGIITFNTNQHYSEQAKKHCLFFRELKKRPTRLEPFFSIWRCIREFKPDIIHTWDSLSSLYVLLPCKLINIPLIDGSIRDAGVDKGINYQLKKFLLNSADLVLGNSYAGLKAYKVDGYVIYNAINTSRFLPHIENGSFNIIMTANFSKYKDHLTFLKAAVQLVQDHTVDKVFLLGEGPNKEKYLNWIIHDYPIIKDQFIFAGAVKNVEEYLANCSVGVLCSTPEYNEGLSNSVLEYMAAGLVPIVTDLGGSPEIIENGLNGYLIKPKDHSIIVELVRLLKNNQELRRKFVLHSNKTIETKFSMKESIDSLCLQYITCLKQ